MNWESRLGHLVIIPKPTLSGDLAELVQRGAEDHLMVIHEPLRVVNVFGKYPRVLLLLPGKKKLMKICSKTVDTV